MNYIFLSENCISGIGCSAESEVHKHWMLQLILSTSGKFKVQINEKDIECGCIIIDSNIPHSFHSEGEIDYVMLIVPTSYIASQIKNKFIRENEFCILDYLNTDFLQSEIRCLLEEVSSDSYCLFLDKLFQLLEIKKRLKNEYNERVHKILNMVAHGDLYNMTIEMLAYRMGLSESRLSHLFKEETGIPLKSYLVLNKLQTAYIHLFQFGNITEAAMISGFDSPSHFAYTSKNLTGMSASNILKDSVFMKVSDF